MRMGWFMKYKRKQLAFSLCFFSAQNDTSFSIVRVRVPLKNTKQIVYLTSNVSSPAAAPLTIGGSGWTSRAPLSAASSRSSSALTAKLVFIVAEGGGGSSEAANLDVTKASAASHSEGVLGLLPDRAHAEGVLSALTARLVVIAAPAL